MAKCILHNVGGKAEQLLSARISFNANFMSAAVKVQRNFYFILVLLVPPCLQIHNCYAADKLPIKLFTIKYEEVATLQKICKRGMCKSKEVSKAIHSSI